MNNPLTDKPYSEKYYKIKKITDTLPANNPKTKKEFTEILEKYNLIFVNAETGAGKSTQTPIHVLEHYDYKFKKKGIVVSQPRKVNASSIAERMADQLDVKLGEEVGYAYRFKRVFSDKTIMKFVTDGLLLRELFNNIEMYDIVMIDEVHTRTPQIDIMLYLIKNYLKLPDVKTKFILMSATLNIPKLEKYFDGIEYQSIYISGRTFPVSDEFIDKDIVPGSLKDLGDKIIEITDKFIVDENEGDILIFLPTKKYIRTIKQRLFTEVKGIIPMELWADMKREKEDIVISRNKWKDIKKEELQKKYNLKISFGRTPIRKVICSTNVAETGLTVDGITCVIDSGLELNNVYVAKYDYEKNNIEYIDKAAIRQRCGRAGRVAVGTCFHLMTKMKYETLENYSKPDILTTNIDTIIIELFNIVPNIEEVKKILSNLIDPVEYVSIKNLIDEDAINMDGTLTSIGKLMLHLGLGVKDTKTLLMANRLDCINDVISVIVYMNTVKSLREFFEESQDKEVDYFNNKMKTFTGDTDLYVYYQIYKKVNDFMRGKRIDRNKIYDWAKRNHFSPKHILNAYLVNLKTIKMAKDVKDDIEKISNEYITDKVKPFNNVKDNIMHSFSFGYASNKLIKTSVHSIKTKNNINILYKFIRDTKFIKKYKNLDNKCIYIGIVISNGNPNVNIMFKSTYGK